MILTHEQLAAITRGADHTFTNETNGRFVMRRCTEKQTEAYGREFGPKCELTAGIRFDFWTDSQTVEFDYVIARRASVVWMSIDLYADGVMVAADYKNTHQSFDKYTFAYRFETAGRRRITIYLPYMVDLQLTEFRVDDGAEVTPYADYTGTMLCFGDSISQGYDAAFPSKSYVNRLTSHLEAYTVNQAIGGERFVPEILLENTEYKPDVITVAYGTNDWSGTKKEYFHPRCEEFFLKLSRIYPDSLRFALLPIWRGDAKSGKQKYEGTLDEACDFIAETAKKYGCTVIDCRPFMPQNPAFFWDGRLHPNDLGFSEYAAGLNAEIEKYL